MLLLLLLSCASGIRSMYEAERDAALGRAEGPTDQWKPDIRVRVSHEALDRLVQAVVAKSVLSWSKSFTVDGPLGLQAKVSPSARVTALTLSPSTSCDGCMTADVTLTGQADWTAAGAKGSVPLEALLGATVRFDLKSAGASWATTGRVTGIDRVKVSTGRLGSFDATELLGDWLGDAVEQAGPLALGEIGGSNLPLRAARIATPRGQLEVQLLSDLVDSAPVSSGTTLDGDFDVRISAPTVLGLARRQAFETGVISHDVAAIPTSLSVDDQSFTMGLRLWKLKGLGWWRDYSVTGTMGLKGGDLVLAASEATEGETSKGAGLADPIALLAEGRILEAITDGLQTAVPASTAIEVADQKLHAKVRAVQGERGTLVMVGELQSVADSGSGRRLSP